MGLTNLNPAPATNLISDPWTAWRLKVDGTLFHFRLLKLADDTLDDIGRLQSIVDWQAQIQGGAGSWLLGSQKTCQTARRCESESLKRQIPLSPTWNGVAVF